jgi:hypothetical protein
MRKKAIDKVKKDFDSLKEHRDYLAKKLVDRDIEISRLENQIEVYKLKLGSYEGSESAVVNISRQSIRNLMEIIRWNVNPKTAEFPFEVEKSQKDEKINRGDFNSRCF